MSRFQMAQIYARRSHLALRKKRHEAGRKGHASRIHAAVQRCPIMRGRQV